MAPITIPGVSIITSKIYLRQRTSFTVSPPNSLSRFRNGNDDKNSKISRGIYIQNCSFFRYEKNHRSEMKFLNGIFSRVGINSSLLTDSDSAFCQVFYPYFSILRNAFDENNRIILFRGFFVGIFKIEQIMVFVKNPPVEGTVKQHGAKYWSLLLKRCPRIPAQATQGNTFTLFPAHLWIFNLKTT